MDWKKFFEQNGQRDVGNIKVEDLFQAFKARIEKETLFAVATASHILVKTEKECLDIKKVIEDGASFADMAKKHSQCPSGKNGGGLGSFKRGQMVPEFDQIAFSGELKKVLGPIKTQFGYHLLWIDSRE
jgi:peptidyl-prolyl cis-trans isomerase C